jgi:hypothetical protein
MQTINSLSSDFIEGCKILTRDTLEDLTASPGATYTSITEALFSITDPHHVHIVEPSLQRPIHDLRLILNEKHLLREPPENIRALKLIVLTVIVNKIQLIIKRELEKQTILSIFSGNDQLSRSNE